MIRRLAVGGMGEIFLARQRGVAGFDRLVILKSLLPDLAADKSSVEEFLDEARVAATLNHPNIIGIYEVGLWNGVYFIAMEYIEGEAVGSLMHDDGGELHRIPAHLAALIVRDASTALHHAHTAVGMDGKPLRIVHRDVSPQNIMVRRDGVTKVLDFGIAKAANRSTRTATGVLKGKLRYMPPEQLRGSELDGRSDQYSLGVVLWEMVTGEKLFKNQLHIAERLLDKPITPPSQIVPGFPAQLEEVIKRMLAVEPKNRYPTCQHAAADIQRYLDSLPETMGPPALAEYVGRVAGERIAERSRDLQSPQENFLISLLPSGESSNRTEARGPEDTSRSQAFKRPNKKGSVALIGGMAALLFAGGIAVTLQLVSKPQPAPKQIQVSATPAVEKKVTPPPPPPVVPPAPKPPVLVLRSEPPGAAVSSGGLILGTTPFELTTLAPGTPHTLVFSKRGFKAKTLELTLEAGARRELDAVLEAEAPPPKSQAKRPPPVANTAPEEKRTEPARAPAATFGFLTLRTAPWTKVSIAGEPYGVTPLFQVRLAAGTHAVHLTNEEANINITRLVNVPAGETVKLDLKLP